MKEVLRIPEDLSPKLREQLSFRVRMTVDSLVIYSPNSHPYPVCPRCQSPLDRSYLDYCDRCGQALSWRGIRNARRICRYRKTGE